ncbi:MAG TPA: hypothetical protein VK020_09360 [Microlunatus sp.]|nr:hypothetical protein [Microlunatus sp.]
MPSKLRTALGVGAATALAAVGLATLPTTAQAGIVCTTIHDRTPVHTKPWKTSPISKRLAKGTDLQCTGGPGWFRVGQGGRWIGYVSVAHLDTTAG